MSLMKAENCYQSDSQLLPVSQFTSPVPITTGNGFHRGKTGGEFVFKSNGSKWYQLPPSAQWG